MGRIARIKQDTGEVVNIIMPYAPPHGFVEVEIPDDSPVQQGYTYANGEFTAPAMPPQENQDSQPPT